MRRKKLVYLEISTYLSEKEKVIDFETFIGYLDEHGTFTPKQLNLLMWKLDESKIDHRKSDYKMKMRRNREKDQLKEMERFQLRNIWPCMTSQQKKRYIEMITNN